MSIILPDPVTTYYIPDRDPYSVDSEVAHLSSSSQAEFWDSEQQQHSSSFAELDRGSSLIEVNRRIVDLRYQDSNVKPSASSQTLESFLTLQKVDSHPVKGVAGMTWCVLSVECPPDQERPSRYIAALDYAMLEGLDAIMIEPFDLSQRTQQWINIMSVVWHLFGCYLSVSVAATISSKMMDQGAAFAGIVNMILLRYYRKYVMGDPISQYRNLDFLSQPDMDRVYHMSELLSVRGAFGSIIIKDSRRERYRYNVLKYMAGFQLGLCAHKFFFGAFLGLYFPNRPL